MKKLPLIVCLATITLYSCVSTQKYKALEADYQKAGETQRNYEQEHKILQVELQDMKKRIERLEADNRALDSTNHELRQRIIFTTQTEDWKNKYETLLEAYNKLNPTEKTRGAEEKKAETEKNEKKSKLIVPVNVYDKPYKDSDKAKEVKMPEKKPEAKSEPPVETVKEVKEVKEEKNTEPSQADRLNSQIQKVLDNYKSSEGIVQNQGQAQIAISFSDDVLFSDKESYKLSVVGEEILNKLVYTLSQYPQITIDLVSGGVYAEEKANKIAYVFQQYNIKTRVLAKNAIPLAFETSGTEKTVSSLILRIE